MSDIDLSIIIPVYNNINFTKSCINDLLHLSNNHEIIVVNNGSDDGTAEALSKIDKITIINNSANLGFSKACNIGFANSNGRNVLFLNNDIRVISNHNNWTDDLISHCDKYLLSPNGGLIDENGNFITETNEIIKGNFYLSGWCLASSRKNFSNLIISPYVGPFSEEFGQAYFEDTDLSFRASELKMPVKIAKVPVCHFGKMTSKKIGLSNLYLTAQKKFKDKWLHKLQNSNIEAYEMPKEQK